MRILVCGGRDYEDLGAVWSQLDAHHALQGQISLIIHGGARGADTLAARWAALNGVPVLPFKADWNAGRSAGPIRNKQMLVEGKPDLVLAFPTSGPGTKDMMKQARKAGVPVVVGCSG